MLTDFFILPFFTRIGSSEHHREDFACDDYVYSHFIRPQNKQITQAQFGLTVHQPGAVFLARVHQNRIAQSRHVYEWFAGVSDGRPLWDTLDRKQPVFEDANGTGWCLSAIYHPGLGRYLLCTEHVRSHAGLLGIFDAPNPWGPWTTVKYWTAEEPFGHSRTGSDLDWRPNVFFLAFPPRWLSDEGNSFTLNFTGSGQGKDNDSFNTLGGRLTINRSGPDRP